ncbi:MAG: VanZ family protein [Desulforhopalus sp.]|jgi:VanZ family protein
MKEPLGIIKSYLGTLAFRLFTVGLFVVLVLVTFTIVNLVPQIINIGDDILTAPAYAKSRSSWLKIGHNKAVLDIQNGNLKLENNESKKTVLIYKKIENSSNFKKLRLRANLKSLEVVAGIKAYNSARLLLLQYSKKEALYTLPHVVASLEGTNENRDYSKVFNISPQTTSLLVAAELSQCAGGLEVGDITLFSVAESHQFMWCKRLILVGWGFLFFILIASYALTVRLPIANVFTLIVFVAIVVGTSMPGEVKESVKQTLLDEVRVGAALNPITISTSGRFERYENVMKFDVTKFAHFCLFSLFVMGVVSLNPLIHVGKVSIDVVMLAIGTELIQFFVEGRNPLVSDVLIDLSGGVLALLSVIAFSRLKSFLHSGL